jgi:sarcosine oxidase
LPDLLGGLALPEAFLAAFPRLQVMQENAYHFPYRDAPEEPWPTFIPQPSTTLIYGLPADATPPSRTAAQQKHRPERGLDD